MRRLVSLLILFAAPLIGGQQPLTIERIVADPPLEGTLPKEIQWLPGGTSFSFLETVGEGKDACSTLWIEDAASGARTRVVGEDELPAVGEGKAAVRPSLAGYRWSPRGDELLLSGGGDLFLVTVPGGSVRRLTDTPSEEELAEFSPDGRWASIVRDNDLWVIELASGQETRLTDTGSPDRLNAKLDWVYQEELTDRKAIGYAWSPDSRWIAYLTFDETRVPHYPIVDRVQSHPTTTDQHYPQPGDRNPVVSLSVVEVEATGGTRAWRSWVPSGNAEYLPRFGWAKRQGSVWFAVLNRQQTELTLNLLDVRSGKVTVLFATTEKGWVDVPEDIVPVTQNTYLLTSEVSGFRHLWLVGPLEYGYGLTAGPVTRGDWEFSSLVTKSDPGKWVLFTANEANPLERQLYRTRRDGDLVLPAERLTADPGTHSVELAPGGAFMLDTYSTATRPPTLRVLDGDGRPLREVTPIRPATLSDFALGRLEFLTVRGPSGATLYASLLKPPNFDPRRKYPVVVYVYGGPNAQVVRDAWGRQTGLFHHVLASRGFLVFSLDNRGSAGRGREFERTLLGRLGKVELEDQLAGVEYLKTLPYVDASRIGIWGWSYGGFMTCYALTNAPGVFKAGAAVAPVTDWRLYDSIYTERYLKLPADNEAGYRDSSPVNLAGKLADALLLIHGTGDDNVHWDNTLAFVDRLYKAGKTYDLQLFPNLRHGIESKRARIQLYQRIADHFLLRLSSQPSGGANPLFVDSFPGGR